MVLAVYLRLPQKAQHAKFWGCCASQFVSMHCVCRRWPPASIAWYIATGHSAGCPERIAGSQRDAANLLGEPLDELLDRMLMGILLRICCSPQVPYMVFKFAVRPFHEEGKHDEGTTASGCLSR